MKEEGIMANKKYDRKYLFLSQRIIIEKGLNNNESFVSIGRKIGKDPSTVSKEVRRNVSRFVKNDMNIGVPCAKCNNCTIRNLCDMNCTVLCNICVC